MILEEEGTRHQLQPQKLASVCEAISQPGSVEAGHGKLHLLYLFIYESISLLKFAV